MLNVNPWATAFIALTKPILGFIVRPYCAKLYVVRVLPMDCEIESKFHIVKGVSQLLRYGLDDLVL